MKVFKLIFRNAGRHKLRTALTVLGMAIAVMAFAVIRTAIAAWYSNAKAAAPDRLVTVNAVSLVFTLPVAYEQKIANVEGVVSVSHAQWFGGIYVDPKNFFPKFAISSEDYLKQYPEFVIPQQQREAFLRERNAALVGRRLADRFGWQVGDQIRITGDIYPGDWDFVIRAIYTGAKENTDEGSMYFNYSYLDERMRQEAPMRAGQVGSFILKIDDPSHVARISDAVDGLFKNSQAETDTQTEESFLMSFVAMVGSIIVGLRIISYLVIGIILLVLANTMAMTARERIGEYAVLKTLGFRRGHILGLIFGESLFIAVMGGGLGLLITPQTVGMMRAALQDFLSVFPLEPMTFVLAGIATFVVGIVAAIFPAIKAVRTSIVDGLRTID